MKAAGILVGIVITLLLFPGMAHAAEQAAGGTITPCTAAMVARQSCTLRSGPSLETEKLDALAPGTVMIACGKSDDGWYQVIYGNELGYVHGNFVSEVPVEEGTLQALAAQADLVKRGALPTGDRGGTEVLPTGDRGGAEVLPTGDRGGTEVLPTGDRGGTEVLPTGDRDGAEVLPMMEDGTSPLPVVPDGGNVIFVGDSRTGQMGNAVGGPGAWPGVAFVACYGGGVEWFSTTEAKKDIDELVTAGSIIVVNYGVNDLSRHGDYIDTINRYAQDWSAKGATVYFATVGPVGENEYGKRNWAVEYFNDQLWGRLNGNIGRIDLYGYLTLSGYGIEPDGMHYTPDTYAGIFQFLMQSIGRA